MRMLIERLRRLLESQGAEGLNWAQVRERDRKAKLPNRYATDRKERFQHWEKGNADDDTPLRRNPAPMSKKEQMVAAQQRNRAFKAQKKAK